jgi:hypothetical protein
MIMLLLTVTIVAAFGQNVAPTATPAATPTPVPEKSPKKKSDKKDDKKGVNDPSRYTAEQVAESAIILYGGSVLGRQNLSQIRKTTLERGKVFITNAQGRTETATYERWILRGEDLAKEKVRLDQIFPDATFSLVYNGSKLFGLYNNAVFIPRDDAAEAFNNQIWHGLEGLLRYKENGATVVLAGREKIMGVEYHLLDVTDKQSNKTRYYVSVKSFRVMFLEYDKGGIRYQRKFYNYNYAQGTLVPYRSVLYANGKQIEELLIGTITFGQKIDEQMFNES